MARTLACRWLVCILLLLATVSCGNDKGAELAPIRFAVVSDLHLFDAALGTGGPDFERDLQSDQRMLVQNEEIFAEVVRSLTGQDSPPDFVLISGDLTKDGERQNHDLVATYLAEFESAGMDVFVVPGNHDINNPHAVRYDNRGSVPVETVSAADFADIYADFGYGGAIARDPDSLSYIAEPAAGLWLFAIDSCRYGENAGIPIVAGRISEATLQWIETHLEAAREQKKTVIGMVHHGVTEHFLGQARQFPEFLIEDWESVGHRLATGGLNVIFTGHFHSQDVTRKEWDDGAFLVDVETGSLASFPCPYRVVELDLGKNEMSLTTSTVTRLALEEGLVGFDDFADFAYRFSADRLLGIIRKEMIARFGPGSGEEESLAPFIADAFMAHYSGDEALKLSTFTEILGMIENEDPVLSTLGESLYSLWHDLPPEDNTLSISM